MRTVRARVGLRLAALALGAWWWAGCSGDEVVGGNADATTDVADARDANDIVDATDATDANDAMDAADVVDAMEASTGCRSNGDCASDPGGPVCDTASGRCVRCVATADTCPASQHCDPMTFVCVDGCRADEGCAGAATGDGGVVDGGDASVPARVCDQAAHRCVQCRADEHCPAGMLCVGQVCVAGCNPGRPCPGGQTCCDGACLDTQSNTAACGACGRACTVANGTPACVAGRCQVGTCTGTFADCDGDATDGCETDTATSGSHCGTCGRACAFANAAGECRAGACAITRCNEGFADCDTSPANGCETDTRTTVTSCGACGRACSFANAAATCAAGVCGLGACAAGYANCDGAAANGCETPTTTTDDCGACGVACTFANAAAVCRAGVCALGACRDGYADCDGNPANGCEADLQTTAGTCGRCETACTYPHAAAVCRAGACSLGDCQAGYADCDGDAANGCEVTLATTVAHCGACGRACSFPNAAATCAAGACVLGACNAGYADCDGVAANGCEVNLQTATGHCGRCDHACSFAGGTAACMAGACVLTMCEAGRGDCDGDRGNGCETDTTASVSHCSACGAACVVPNATASCAASACGVAGCMTGFADCNGRPPDGCEVSLRTDVSNCGGCGRACALPDAVPACVAGGCAVATCNTGFGDCDARDDTGCETDLRVTSTSCGVCGRACSFPHAAPGCRDGGCVLVSCDEGYADCNGVATDGCEVDVRVNVANCGACDRACSFPNAAATCAAGVCGLGACNAGYADCDGAASNGCETDTRTAVEHCGACGRVCATGRCTAGACDRGGDGSDGTLTVTTPTTLTPVATPLVADVAAGGTSLRVISATGFAVGNEVLVIDAQGTDAGHYEFGRVTAVTSNTLTLASGVAAAFRSADRVQVVRVLRYAALTINAGQSLSVAPWNGTTGGVAAIRVAGTASVLGDLVASGRGFRGGAGDPGGRVCGAGRQGESPTGTGGASTAANGGGGGGGAGGVFCCGGSGQSPGGGGGGYGASGASGTGASGPGVGGGAYGDVALSRAFLGSGGGGGGGNCDVPSGGGGAGGGAIFLWADTLTVTGSVTASGLQGALGGSYEGGGAGGAGGTLFLGGRAVTLTAGRVTSSGGASNTSGSGVGGAGAVGRIRVECATLNGAACPGASGAVTTPAASVGTW